MWYFRRGKAGLSVFLEWVFKIRAIDLLQTTDHGSIMIAKMCQCSKLLS